MTKSESLIAALKNRGKTPPEDLLIAFSYNLRDGKRFSRTRGIGCATHQRLYLYDEDGSERQIDLTQANELRMENLVGSYSVVCENKDGTVDLLFSGDMRTHREAAAAVGYINSMLRAPDLAVRRELVAVCPKCGRTLRREGDVCLRCANRVKSLRRLWGFTRGVRGYLAIGVLLFFVTSLIELLAPYVQRVFVDDYVRAATPPALRPFVLIVLTMAGITVLSVIVSVLRSVFITIAGTTVVVNLRQLVFEKIHALSLSGVTKRPTGELIGRVTQDTNVLQQFLVSDLTNLAQQLILLFGVGTIVVFYDWKLALLVIVPVPFVVLFHRLFWNTMRRLWNKQWTFERKSSTILYDTYQGVRVVKSFGMEHREIERYNKAVDDQRDISMKNEQIWAVINPLISLFAGLGEFFLLYYVGQKILDGGMTLGEMTQFSSYVGLLYGPLRWMAMIPRRLVNALTSVVKIFEIVDEKSDVPASEHPVDLPIEGKIEFDDVSFGYNDGQTVLRHVSFSVQPGEMIGIVGKSGAGKSTLINLVMRLYDAENGTIRVDGVNIKDISEEHLRSQIGVVLQETFLFSGTIYDNIAYAKPTATRDEVIRAAKAAGAHPFILKLTDGYNTKVGERGHTLSGGERQRIAIARALLHDPKILILDEATASLDTETEKQLQDALLRLMEGRTTIAIAHRLSTLRNANRLIVIDNGTIAEQGSHDQLMEAGGIYHGLVEAQRSMNQLS